MPAESTNGLKIAAVCHRQYPEDVLISANSVQSFVDLPAGSLIGTCSARRGAMVKHLRPDVIAVPIRGNIETRLAKLDSGQADAIILARAGLERLGLGGKISFVFNPEEFIPAPAQGALAVQTRVDNPEIAKLLSAVDHKPTHTVVSAERLVLARLHPGCHAPVGVFARSVKSDIIITAFVSDADGKRFMRQEKVGPVLNTEKLAIELANELIDAGAAELLQIERQS